MKIVLLGYMASGKSVVGYDLARQLDYEFIDLDKYIEKREGLHISDIFSEKGEIYFRTIETNYLEEIFSKKNNFVLSLGGGTPCYGKNMELIIDNSVSFYLKTSVNELYERLLMGKLDRPLVATIESTKLKEFIAKHLFERSGFYEKADYSVHTDEKTLHEIVKSIEKEISLNKL